MSNKNLHVLFGRNLQHLMSARDVSIFDFAIDLGVSWRQVYRWRDGVCFPQGSNLATIASYFGVDPDALYAERLPVAGRKRTRRSAARA